ncbi:MAG: plasmid mobilization relaxosome protein MobC [Tenuifilaceae bacterium]
MAALKRTKIFRVRLSFAEQSLIKRKAKEVGRTQSRFVREAALGIEIKLKRFTEEEKEMYRTLVGLANNLNQIAKKYNQGNRMFTELDKTLSAIQVVIDKLIGYDRKD